MIKEQSAYESIVITSRAWQDEEFKEVKEKIRAVCEEFNGLEIEEKSGKLFYQE